MKKANKKVKIPIRIKGSKLKDQIDQIDSELKKVSTYKTPKQVTEVRRKYFNGLSNILDMGFIYHGVPYSPLLKNIIGKENVAKLGVKPLKEEQTMFNEFFDYLIDYYKITPQGDIVEVLKKSAEDDPGSFGKAEAFYELSQLVSALGHTSYPEIGADRIKRLKVYKDRKRWFRPNPKAFEMAFNYALSIWSSPIVPSHNVINSADEVFAGKGPKNSGDPYFMKDSTPLDNGLTVKQTVKHMSAFVWKEMNHTCGNEVNDASKLVSVYATLFGRNQTKGIDYKIEGDAEKDKGVLNIIEFKAAGRCIYGVSRLVNNICTMFYYPLSLHMRNQPEMVVTKGPQAVTESILKIAELDKKYKVMRENEDVGKYDTSISSKLMITIAIFDMLAFAANDVAKKLIFLTLVIDAMNPIFYKEEKGGEVKLLRAYGGHKSGAAITLDGGSRINYICTLSVLLEIDPTYLDLVIAYRMRGVSYITVAGDDLSVAFKNREHAERFRKLMYSRYGFEMNQAKNAPGSPFVQYFPNKQGKCSYPLARCLRAILYPENPDQQPGAMFVITCGQQISYLFDSPHINFFIKFILKHDDAKLGRRDPNTGKELSQEEFMQIYKDQAADGAGQNDKNKENGKRKKRRKAHQLDKNDPRYSMMFDEKGELKVDFASKIGRIVSSNID